MSLMSNITSPLGLRDFALSVPQHGFSATYARVPLRLTLTLWGIHPRIDGAHVARGAAAPMDRSHLRRTPRPAVDFGSGGVLGAVEGPTIRCELSGMKEEPW